MKIRWPAETWKINLRWTKPLPPKSTWQEFHDSLSEEAQGGYFYCITGKHGSSPRRIFYVGMTYKQFVADRLYKYGLAKCRKNYKNHKLGISIGILQGGSYGKVTLRLVQSVETLLIYSLWSDYMLNSKSTLSGGTTQQFLVHNTGYTGIPPFIFWGASVAKKTPM